MSVSLQVPTTAWVEQNVELNGEVFQFIYSLNSRDARLRLDVLQGEEVINSGIKIMENQSLFQYYALSELISGDIFCLRLKNTNEPVTLGNLGIDKEYELVYFTDEEIQELVDG